jgi:hypothetical protein
MNLEVKVDSKLCLVMHVTHEPMNLEEKVVLNTKTLVINGVAHIFKLLNLKRH